MLNPEERGIMSHKNIQQQHQNQAYKTTVLNLQSALEKQPEHRNQTQQQNINEFISLSPYLRDISEQISIDFSRNMVKKAKIYYVNGKKKVYEKGQTMKVIFMPLCGAIYLRNTKKNVLSQDIKATYDSLISTVKKKKLQLKNNMQLQKRASLQFDFKVQAVPHWQDLTNMVRLEKEGLLMLGDIYNQKYTEGMYVNGQGWLLGIEVKKIIQCLLEEYDRRIIKQASYFRTLRCFDILQDSELKKFIENIQLVDFKKDDYIYRQGDISKFLYLLIEGQAKVTKMAQLFKEDPNSLYQRTVRSQSSRRPQSPSQLSYVNFQGVYNYAPQVRRIQLGIVSPITIFGDEEISTASLSFRETEVQVISSQLKAYRFTLKELQSSGNGRKIDITKFMSDLYDYLTEKRIIKRRESLRSSLQFQNRQNMNYFFLNEESVQKRRSKSSRDKINNYINYRDSSKSERPKSAVKPRYTNLNFTQFLTKQNPRRNQEPNLSFEEKSVSKLTHNSTDIMEKVQNQLSLFTKLQGYRHKINIDNPLFDSNYYKKQRKQILRIQNKRRMNRIEVKGITTSRSRSRKQRN